VRRLLGPFLAAAFLLMGAAPAAPPDHPVRFISVDELKALVDRGTRADLIDVRTLEEYEQLHIRGARSIPLRSVRDHAREIPKSGLVVFY
jgi:rhodanese-related sulfurtransferase